MGNISSTIDMKLVDTNKSTSIEEKYNETLKHLNDEDKSLNMFFEILKMFMEKYKIDKIDKNNLYGFRKDGKLVFLLMKKLFDYSGLNEDMEKINNSDTISIINEANEYKNFIININYIIDNIETTDLLDEENDFSETCKKTICYLNEKNKEMSELNDRIITLNKSIESTIDTLNSLSIN